MFEAKTLAACLATRLPVSVLAVKRAVHVGAELPLAAGLALEKLGFLETGLSREAARAGPYYLDNYSQGKSPREIFDQSVPRRYGIGF